jgi:hypothetical protein
MGFDASQHEPAKPFEREPVPPGKYPVRILDAEERSTSKGDGTYIAFALEVSSGPCTGRKLWHNITTSNPSDKAVQIGLGQLSALTRSVGMMKWRSEKELVGRIGDVVVGIDPKDKTRNQVNGWLVEKAAQVAPVTNPPKTAHYGGAAIQQRPASPPSGGYGPPPAQARQQQQARPAAVPFGNGEPPPGPAGDPGYFDSDVPF